MHPPRGAILDGDSVAEAVAKLARHHSAIAETQRFLFDTRYPKEVLNHRTLRESARRIQTVLVTRGRVLLDDGPIGSQCMEARFNRFFQPSVERSGTRPLSCRAHRDPRWSSIAFKEPATMPLLPSSLVTA